MFCEDQYFALAHSVSFCFMISYFTSMFVLSSHILVAVYLFYPLTFWLLYICFILSHFGCCVFVFSSHILVVYLFSPLTFWLCMFVLSSHILVVICLFSPLTFWLLYVCFLLSHFGCCMFVFPSHILVVVCLVHMLCAPGLSLFHAWLLSVWNIVSL